VADPCSKTCKYQIWKPWSPGRCLPQAHCVCTVFKHMQHWVKSQPFVASYVVRITDTAAVKLPVVVVMWTSCGLSFDIQLM